MSEHMDDVEVLRVSPLDLLLDPNSYRLVDDPLWEPVPDERIAEDGIQLRTYETVMHRPRYGVRDLRRSMEEHGWLDVEPVWVRRLAGGSLVIVDGNQRVVAWRSLFANGNRQLRMFSSVHVSDEIRVHILEDPAAHETSLALGLRHLLTPAPWPLLGAAIWRERHHADHGELPTSAIGGPYRRWSTDVEVQALDLARAFKRGPWGADFHPGIYTILGDALANRRLREWLGFDDPKPDEARLNRFFTWLVPHVDEDVEPDEGGQRPRAPIRSRFDLRSLSLFLDQPDLLARLDLGDRVDEIASVHRTQEEPDNHLHPWVATRIAQKAPIDPARAQEAMRQLREAVLRAGEQPVEPGTDHPWPLLEPAAPLFLRSLSLRRFRGLADLDLEDLGQVNLLVGVNNAGKTSVLEALYILSRLSDPRGVLDTLRLRTRQDPERNPTWLSDLVSALEIDLAATDAGERHVTVRLERPPAPEGVDLATHIPGLRFRATVDGTAHVTDTALFSNRPRRTVQVEGESNWLAPAVLHSPFARLDRTALVHWYEASVDSGSLGDILDTLREAVDPGIKDVRLVSESGRFVVEHDELPPMDLVSFGEGVQRVFEIGLLFAAHRGGLVLVDEVETAIHTSALLRFTHMIQQLAHDFDVQVFLTTHSKEAVDAFLLNEYRNEDVVAYLLKRTDVGVQSWRYDGPTLKRAVEVGDVDIRRL